MTVSTFLACAAVFLPIWLYFFKTVRLAYDSDLRKIPGPFISRFTNLPLKFQVIGGQRTVYIHRLHQKYGPIVRIAPDEVGVADITAYHLIHKVGTRFTKGQWYQNQSPTQYDDDTCGVFGVRDAKKASARRRLFQLAGTKAAVIQWEQMLVQIVHKAVDKIKRDAKTSSADIFKWWQMMTLDVLGEIAFAESFKVLEMEQKPELVRDIENSMLLAFLRKELPLIWYVMEILPLKVCQSGVHIFDRLAEAGGIAVQNTKLGTKGTAKTLFSKMIPEDPTEQQLPDSLVAKEAANVIIAGSDTTSNTLTYLVYSVLRDPVVTAKLVDELKSCPENPSWEQLEALPYLNNMILETLRLYSAVPGSLPRDSPPQGAILGGFRIPAGTTVVTQAYTFHRNEEVFPEPEKFIPDRWTNVTPQMKEYFMPFGGSARACLGQNLARLELLHAVFTFFRECPNARLAESTTSESMDILDYFVIKPKGGRCDIIIR